MRYLIYLALALLTAAQVYSQFEIKSLKSKNSDLEATLNAMPEATNKQLEEFAADILKLRNDIATLSDAQNATAAADHLSPDHPFVQYQQAVKDYEVAYLGMLRELILSSDSKDQTAAAITVNNLIKDAEDKKRIMDKLEREYREGYAEEKSTGDAG